MNIDNELLLSNEFVLIPTKQYDVTVIIFNQNTRTEIDIYFKDIPNDSVIKQLKVLGGCDGIYVDTIDVLDEDKFTPDALNFINSELNQYDEDTYKKEWYIDISPLYDEKEIIDKVVTYFISLFSKEQVLIKYKSRPNDNEFSVALI